MSRNLIGVRVRLRLFAPGESLAAVCTGIITEQMRSQNADSHDGYKIRLDESVRIGPDIVTLVHAWPSGRYAFEPGTNKMDDLFHESVYTTVSWQLDNGEWMSYGDKGTFAEVSVAS
jgi:hypothetical protein